MQAKICARLQRPKTNQKAAQALTDISSNTGGRVWRTTARVHFRLVNLELFDPVAQEKDQHEYLQQSTQSNLRKSRNLNRHQSSRQPLLKHKQQIEALDTKVIAQWPRRKTRTRWREVHGQRCNRTEHS
jgi:tmRNA-binding protein